MAQALLSERAPSVRRLPRVVAFDAAVAAVGSGLLIGGVAAASGGYFATSWGWTAVALLWAIALALLLRSVFEIGVAELVFFGALVLFAMWIWLGTTWSESVPRSFLEGERVLVYVAAAAAALLLIHRRTVPQLLGGVLFAIVFICGYGLATRLLPNRIGTFDPAAGYRLEGPIGYWNALGIFAVMGALLALGFAARGRSAITRGFGASALAILLPALYFTYSRASWIVLAIGIVALVVYEQRRLQLVTAFALAAAAPGVTVLIASRSTALTHQTASIGAATQDGKRFAVTLLIAAAVSWSLAAGLARGERSLRPPRWLLISYAAGLAALVAAGFWVAVARYGSPPTMARKAYDSFLARPVHLSRDASLNDRLFSFSSNGRVDLWKVAWSDYKRHPWLGSGPGSYEQQWDRHRPTTLNVRDAHNLYLEQLAEVGPFGLALLLLALATPLAVAVRARGAPLAGAALAAYVAFLVHAAVDWDWEVTALTLVALLCAVALLASRRPEREPRAFDLPARLAALAVTAALAALALVGLVGNLALASSRHAAVRHDWQRSAAQARRAANWAPWSSDAPDLLGQAELQQGHIAAAAASFRRALAKDPQEWQLWLDLYSATSGREAQHAFRRTYELNPRGDAG